MNLLDTQLIIWLYNSPEQVPPLARRIVTDPKLLLFYSPISLLEIQIKNAKGRKDFQVN